MTQRYFVPSPVPIEQVRIAGSEAHHMLHVMRVSRGQSVLLFDGVGNEYDAEISATGRDWVDLTIQSSRCVDRELPGELTIAVALPKGDRQKFLVEKLVELGASRLVPIATERGVAYYSDGAQVRLERVVVEASKQCGRNRLMQIAPSIRCIDFLRKPTEGTKIIAHPDGRSLIDVTFQSPICVVVGPEGGFSTNEIAAAEQANWYAVDLGARILRVETAAIFLASLASARISI